MPTETGRAEEEIVQGQARKLLVAGASGVVGRAMLRHFGAVGGWDLTGLSRRLLDVPDSVRVLPLDLQDPAACEAAVAAQLSDTTHLVYCATFEKPNLLAGWLDPDHAAVNEAMLRNLMEPLRRHAKGLQAVLVMQGTKAYGAAAGTFKLPASEEDPRALAPNFYYGQEDYVREAAVADGWRWTALRPQFVCGFALGSPMNGLSGVAAYAAISRELGLPLRFPGGVGRVMEVISEGVGARRTIFLVERVLRGRVGKGGLRRPILGVIMNFWLVVGMWRSFSIWRESSVMVASDRKSRVCEVPWWVKVMLLVGELSASGVAGAPSRDGGAGGCSTPAITK